MTGHVVETLKARIRREGKNLGNGILKVDGCNSQSPSPFACVTATHFPRFTVARTGGGWIALPGGLAESFGDQGVRSRAGSGTGLTDEPNIVRLLPMVTSCEPVHG